ncbi:50S ribosomal protein L4 [Candidatus Peribacteria bacterium RIFCSPHIGHO2_02_FULL_53_20]|nr:MAG: 50S ribosomal protein L4 [Candidatus Peribacteria bacterium RIFCSPHIGHO2_02_FULL_53_20]OGJ67477.1 MAG: 50S ribosomal protein L4 [Candidatus Peribacteria bacterium RIFCSPLOWO2_01_FULL_53_10]OGJ70637.1 MAG: 50S ribosomal protein L4 [Candidatus Peribacteria bacterium RIFCSPLOWO2_12_FULL_53_10]
MKIDVYSATGAKKGSLDLPATLFEAAINQGLMHQAVVMQQSNRRRPIAHAKNRGEVIGSTKKMFAQKGTGRARRGPLRSPLLRGGGKAFGPRSNRNYHKDMPKTMRRVALLSALSAQAKSGSIMGLENYPETVKTKEAATCLGKMPVELGRKILIVTPSRHRGIALSTRNIPNVRAISAAYLNPEDVLGARHIIFFVDAIAEAEKIFGGERDRTERAVKSPVAVAPDKTKKKMTKKTKTNSAKSSSVSEPEPKL